MAKKTLKHLQFDSAGALLSRSFPRIILSDYSWKDCFQKAKQILQNQNAIDTLNSLPCRTPLSIKRAFAMPDTLFPPMDHPTQLTPSPMSEAAKPLKWFLEPSDVVDDEISRRTESDELSQFYEGKDPNEGAPSLLG